MIDWQKRFVEQLKWTEQLRNYLYNKIDIRYRKKVLEIGCGTGALLTELGINFDLELYGMDIDGDRLNLAKKELDQHKIKVKLLHMDILNNDFQDNEFDVVITNCLFLWIKDLRKIFEEIYRILINKGVLLIFAEPDYGGLVEYPNTNLKEALFSNLLSEGADPEVGRKLNQYFVYKFLVKEQFCTSIPWIANNNQEALLKELDFFRTLLSPNEFNNELMRHSIKNNKYFIFVPVFSYYLEKI
ncbi:MAG: class I SAM-dependent methyltransferase [Promethearchaeota archaeon]